MKALLLRALRVKSPSEAARGRRRELHRRYARLLGYFWLPCHLCGTMFGGHEWKDRNGLSCRVYPYPLQPMLGMGICPDCTRAGRGESRPAPLHDRPCGDVTDPECWRR